MAIIASDRLGLGFAESRGLNMVPIGSTKPRLGDIWPQLAVSACVLLAPPLLMAAGLTYFGSPPPQSAAPAATAAGADTVSKPISFAPPDVGQGATLGQGARLGQGASLGQGANLGQGASFVTASAQQRPIVTQAHPRVDAPAPVDQTAALGAAETTKDTSAAAPEHSPDATRKVARNEPHNGHAARRQRTLSDIFPFLRPSSR
jgi:hypothetical protein